MLTKLIQPSRLPSELVSGPKTGGIIEEVGANVEMLDEPSDELIEFNWEYPQELTEMVSNFLLLFILLIH